MEECCFYFVKQWHQGWLNKENITTLASREIRDWWDIIQVLPFPQKSVAGSDELPALFFRAKNIRTVTSIEHPPLRFSHLNSLCRTL